jgi:hypothetical protein
MVEPGDVIPPVTWSGDRVAGNVFATGRTAAEAMARADALAAAITLTTAPAYAGAAATPPGR